MLARLSGWPRRGWRPFAFQRQVWRAMAAGASGLLHATTGAGKTYAVVLGALARAQALGHRADAAQPPPLGVLWLTPMRALAADTERARQDRRLPSWLVWCWNWRSSTPAWPACAACKSAPRRCARPAPSRWR